METIDRTFVAIKPDAVQRGVVGEIIARFEQAGLKLVALKMVWPTETLLEGHYAEHVEKEFFKDLIEFMQEGPVVAGVLEGVEAVAVVRKFVGDTEPKEAAPGTIRGDFAHVSYAHAEAVDKAVKNVIHASGNQEEARQEIALWFDEDEIQAYERSDVDDTH